MTLVDTSVWVDFFRGARRAVNLEALLEADEIVVHSWVIGELALGGLGDRQAAILADLDLLASATVVSDSEVMELVSARSLAGQGIGWVDAQLLASALVDRCRIWTFDRSLRTVAKRLGVD